MYGKIFFILSTMTLLLIGYCDSQSQNKDSIEVKSEFETEEIKVEETLPATSITFPKSELAGRELEDSKGLPLAEMLKSLTGVSSINTGSSISKPIIHGFSGNRILILNNGIRQEGQQWGFEHAPEIDPFIAKKFTVIKGANSVRYGSDAIGGVILVEPKPLQFNKRIDAELNMIGLSNGRTGIISANVDGNFQKLKNFSFHLQGTAKKSGNISTPGYTLKNTGYDELNFSSAIGYSNYKNFSSEVYFSSYNSKLGIFSGSHIGNLTDLINAIQNKIPFDTSSFSYKIERPYQDVDHLLFKSESTLLLGNGNALSFEYAWQNNRRKEFDKDVPADPSKRYLPELDFEITTNIAELNFEHNLSGSYEGVAGVTGSRQTNIGRGRVFIPNFENYAGGIFLVERFMGNNFELEAGVRYDYKWQKIYKYENNVIISPEFTYGNFSSSLGGMYRIHDKAHITLNIGTAWRPPSINEMFSDGLHHGSAAIEIGDPDLQPERAYNVIGGLTFNNIGNFSGEVVMYYNNIRNYIYLAPVPPPVLTIRGAFPTFYYKFADAEFKGVDYNFKLDITKNIELGSKGSLIRAFNKSADDYLFLIPPDRFENFINFKANELSFLNNVYLKISLATNLKQTRVPKETDYSPPPEGYNLVNVDLGYAFEIGPQTIKMTVSANNIFDVSYRDYLNRFRYFTDDIGRNIILRVFLPVSFN